MAIMQKVKIVHCSDFHMDTPFQTHFDKNVSEQRREEIREAFGTIIELCKKEKADILLICGDIIDNDYISQKTISYLINKFKEIENTRVFICLGNHDFYNKSSFINFPENVYLFKNNHIEKFEIPQLNLCVYGASFVSRYQKESMLKGFAALDKNKINIMLMHGDVVLNGQQSEYNPIYLTDIEKSGLDYLALGHKHLFSQIQKAGEVFYAYSGTPEGRGFDELGEKGVICGEIFKNHNNLKFIKTSKRQYNELYIDVTGALTYEEIYSKIKENIDETSKNNFYKIILIGKIDEGFNLILSILSEKIKDDFYFAKIIDKTTISIDLESLSLEYSLKGIFVKNMLNKIKNEKLPNEKEKLELALKIGLCAFENQRVNNL